MCMLAKGRVKREVQVVFRAVVFIPGIVLLSMLGLSCCQEGACGNGVLDDGEECDGADLGGATCYSGLCQEADPGPGWCAALCALDVDCPEGATCGVLDVEPGLTTGACRP